MENEVVIHVRAEDDTAAGFAKARQSAKKLGEDIERDLKQAGAKGGKGLAAGIGQGLDAGRGDVLGRVSDLGSGVGGILGDAGESAGKRLGDGIGDGFDGGAPGVLSSVSTLAADIADELTEAGRRGGEGISKGIGDGMRKRSGGDGDGGLIPGVFGKGIKSGIAAGKGVVEGLGSILLSVGDNPKVVGALALVGATAAPLLAGVLGAAVVGGAAGLGIAGGFAAAAMDPRVKGAAEALKDTVSDDLKDAVKPFVPEAVAAIGKVRAAWVGILPDIKSIFKSSGDVMDPLIDGALEGVTALVEGIESAIASSGPVVAGFGDMFAEVGDALGDLLVRAADDSDTWAAALDFLTGALVAAIDSISLFLEVSASIIDAFRPIGGAIADATTAVNDWWFALTEGEDAISANDLAQGEWHDGVADTTDAIYEQTEALRALEQQMRKQTDPLFEVLDLQTKVRLAQERYNKAVKESGPESGKARKALLDMGKASFELTSALTSAASEGFDGKLTPAMRSALRNAGSTAKQIDALEKELIAAWRAANKWSGTYTQTYITRYKEYGLKSPSPVYQGYAHGGVVGAANGSMSSGLTMVGESGPELVKLPAGTQVSSNADTQRALAGGGGGGGARGAQGAAGLQAFIRFDPSGNTKLIRALMESLRAEIRSEGGNVQTVLGIG